MSKYKVWDNVRIVSKRTVYMNQSWQMDKYLWTVMTINIFDSSFSNPYRMDEDKWDWHWSDDMIEWLVHDFEPYEGENDTCEFKVWDKVRIRKDSEYCHQSKLVWVIESIRTGDITPYKVTFSDGYNNSYGNQDLEFINHIYRIGDVVKVINSIDFSHSLKKNDW